MDEFDKNDDLLNEDSEKGNDNIGEITGFDDTDKSENYNESGFYTKSHSDIVQDEKNDFEHNSFNDNKPNNNYYQNPIVDSKPKKEKRKYGAGIVIIASILSAIIAVSASVLVLNKINNRTFVYPEDLPQIEEPNLPAEEKNDSSQQSTNNENTNAVSQADSVKSASSIAQNVANNCSKSVVGIRTTTSVISFFGGTSEATGEGSGVVYTEDGYIVTNYHVIENAVTSSNASKIEVFFDNANTTPHEATVIGYNIASDLAVLKINAKGLRKANIGNSEGLSIGQYVVTIGAPGGLEFMGSVTYGIISGLNRVVSSDSNIGLIQTDAAINPGNSGGALLDENGKLIGVNSSKIVSEEFEGMGFAIPVNTVVKICNGIITNKDKSEPYVGITISDKYTADVLKSYGYPVGAVVLSVADGSTAESCGIKKGDIITEFNGTEITEYNVFGEVLSKCTPNTSVSIKIYRSGRYYQAKITIGSNS